MGRGYATISPGFWAGHTGRKIRAMGPKAQLVALYLVTCPASAATGVYYLPLPTLAHETNCTCEEVRFILQALESVEFAVYDETEEMVWVPNMAREQIDKIDKVTDKRWKWLVGEVNSFKTSRFFTPWIERYRDRFLLQEVFASPSKDLGRTFEGDAEKHDEGEERPSKPSASLNSIIKQHHSAAAASGAPDPAPAAAASISGLPLWMDQELRSLGLSEKNLTELLQRIGLDGIRAALAKLRSKPSRENPAGLLIRKAEELAEEGKAQLEKSLKRALSLTPGAATSSGWADLPQELRDDPEAAIAWCMLLKASQDEARASEHTRSEFVPVRVQAETLFTELALARHPTPKALIEEVERSVEHSPPAWKAQARSVAVLRGLGLMPLKHASGGL